MSGANALPGDLEREREDLDLLRRRVVNVVGHALRTPMATLRGRAEVLALEPDEERRREVADDLLRAARRLEKLLDDLLVAAEIDTRLPVGRPVPVSVGALAEEVAPDASINDDGTPVLVAEDALRWILTNLVDNAEVYGDGPVEIRSERAGEAVRIAVGSSGPTVPDEDLRLAFEPFYRGEHAVIRNAAGLGIGLTVARRIAQHAGGELSLERRPEGGVDAVLEVPSA